MSTKKTDIRSLTLEELTARFLAMGEKAYRAKQVYEWIWKKSAHTFEEMTNLSLELRDKIKSEFEIHGIQLADKQISEDKTIKCAFTLYDGNVVEGVLIPTTTRMTACVSSQVGCSLTCAFCATGKLKRVRNLDPDEIYDQVAALKKEAENNYKLPLSNVVYMGMGEPLLNYKNTITSVEKLTSPNGLGMSHNRITISTAGIAKMIMKLGDDGVKFNLALSLHAANDEKRNKIMPINEQNSLANLAEALKYFYAKTGTRVTYEYIIFKNFNDEIEDAKELAAFCKHIPCKVNIIEYNAIDDGEYEQADSKKVEAFAQYLISKKIVVNIRRSRGKDIDAACGQLANKNNAALKD